jgi:hypothetical protein
MLLWFSAYILFCADATGHVDALGLGGHTSWRVTCALEAAGFALGGLFLILAFDAYEDAATNGKGYSPAQMRRVRVWFVGIGLFSVFFVLPSSACLVGTGGVSWPVGGPYGRELGCFIGSGLLTLLFAPLLVWLAWSAGRE